MNLLFDQNISFRITKKIKHFFSTCKHISDCGLAGCEGSDIWDYAKKNHYAIVTFDSDFYDISLIKGHPPKIVWIRTGNLGTKQIAALIINNKNLILDFLISEDFKNYACIELEV